jgi:hypothetical protein
MAALAFVAAGFEPVCRGERAAGGTVQRRLGQREQEAGLHHLRQQPARVVPGGEVEVLARIAVEGQHAPESHLGRGEPGS